MPKDRTSVVCLKASVADSTRFDMIAITSSKHVPKPITALATMLPIIVADTCCQYSGLLMQEATSKRGYIISQFAVSTSELGTYCSTESYQARIQLLAKGVVVI